MTSTTQVQADTNVSQLAPYIFFYGRTEEALEFYKSIFGGTYEIMRGAETPMADKIPPEFRDKVMHSSFQAPGLNFMASDGNEAKTVDPDAGNISLALSAKDRAEGERTFNALSQGGKVSMPLDDAFWGGRFGVLQDRFGIEWMISSP